MTASPAVPAPPVAVAWLRHPVALPVVVALLCIALLSGVGVIAGHEAAHTVQHDAQQRVRSNRDAAVRALVRQTDDFTRTVAAWTTDPALVDSLGHPSPATRAAARPPLSVLALSKASPAAFLAGLSGRIAALYPNDPALVGKDFSFRDWFTGVSRTGRPYVSAAYRSAADGQPLVVGVSAPVVRAGRRLGYLTVLWQLASVRAVAEGSRHDDGISIEVTDQAGQQLTGPLTFDARGQSQPAPAEAGDRPGPFQASAPVPGIGWTVTAALPASAALAPARRFERSLAVTVGAAVLLLLLLTALAVRLTRRLAAGQRDATESLQALAAALAEREAFLSTLFDTVAVAVLACDSTGALTMANRQARTMFGVAEETSLAGLAAMRLTHPDGRPMERSERPLARAMTEGAVRDIELRVAVVGERAPRALLAHARRMTGPQGEVTGAVVALHDVTAIREAESALRASEGRFRRVFDEGLIGKLIVQPDGRILRVNTTLGRMLQRAGSALVGQPLEGLFVDADDRTRVRALIAAGDGELRGEMAVSDARGGRLWCLTALSWLTENDRERVLLAQVEDVTARRAAEERLTELALHDELTGLPNRRLLLERCEHAFAVARSGRVGHSTVAALFLDLDGFKPINDAGGHDIGDQVLVAVACDLQHAVRPSDTVARVGGDEFVILLEQDDGLAHLRGVAERVVAAVRRVVPVGQEQLPLSASVGIARVDLRLEPQLHPDELLHRADVAMYLAKQGGRDRLEVYVAEPPDGA